MHHFFFNNETLPKSDNIHVFTDLFKNTLREFETLIKEDSLNVFKGLVTEKLPSEINLGGFTLANAIDNIDDTELKKLAYYYFTKYPVEDHFELEEIVTLLEKECYFEIDGKEYDTLYLTFIAFFGRTAFTVPIHKNLQANILKLTSRTQKGDLALYNLFGEQSNTVFIRDYLLQLVKEQLSLFERLIVTLDNPVFPPSFEKAFFKLTTAEQASIVDEFEKCIARDLTTPLYPDNQRIKDVTPNNAKCNVYELRVYSPTALRVYFNEGEEKVYLGSIEKKSNPDQNKDIKRAHSIIHKLILTNS